jgi:hypothetical protein
VRQAVRKLPEGIVVSTEAAQLVSSIAHWTVSAWAAYQGTVHSEISFFDVCQGVYTTIFRQLQYRQNGMGRRRKSRISSMFFAL